MTLRPPFNLNRLQAIARSALTVERIDLRAAVSWLADVLDEEEMRRRIVEVWRQLATPLREWADGVRRVELRIEKADLWLQVDLGDGRQVRQYPPLSAEYLDSLLAGWPQQPPAVILDLAKSAPGLCIGTTGRLAWPGFFQDRMAYTCDWAEDIGPSPEECRRLGHEYPTREGFLMEVAEDGIGNTFVLRRDLTLHFFDHEECVLRPCRISVEDLFAAYFRDPQLVFDDPYLGIEHPRPAPLEDKYQPPRCLAQRGCNALSNLAQIAVAVRIMRRARPASQMSIPFQWQLYSDELDKLIDACQNVCVSGVALAPEVTRIGRAVVQAAAERCYERDLSEFYHSYGVAEFASGVENLLAAAGQTSDSKASAWVAFKACEGFHDEGPEWWTPVFADTAWLVDCDLGPAGSVGKPVPQAFFDRPL